MHNWKLSLVMLGSLVVTGLLTSCSLGGTANPGRPPENTSGDQELERRVERLENLLKVPTPRPVDLSTGLIGRWSGEGNSKDLTALNHGFLNDGATYAQGIDGQSFSLDGVDDHVRIPFSPKLQLSKFSVVAWVKPLSSVSDPINQEVIFAQNAGGSHLVVRPGEMGLKVVLVPSVSTGEIPVGEFSHIAATYDGMNVRIYLNGILNTVSESKPRSYSDCPFFIGGFVPADGEGGPHGGCGWGPGQFFHGLIDEVGYYNRALSESEIQAIYHGRGVAKN